MIEYWTKRWELDMHFLSEYWYIILIVIAICILVDYKRKKKN